MTYDKTKVIKELLDNEEMEVNESEYLKQLIKMEQQTESEKVLSMSVGDFLSFPNGEKELTNSKEVENELTEFELNTTINHENN